MNQLVEVIVDSLGAQGDGVCSHDGLPLYVAGGVPGDRLQVRVVEQKRNSLTGTIEQILEPSENRAEPACQYFGKCGGCQLQHLTTGFYASWLKDRLAAPFIQQGFDILDILDPLVSPPSSRRRLTLKALRLKDRLVLGFNKAGSHQIVDISACPVAEPALAALFQPLRDTMAPILADRMSASVSLTQTSSGVELLVKASKALTLDDREALVAFADAHDLAAVHWDEGGFLDPVAIRREPVMKLGGVMAPLAPGGFVQATRQGEQALQKAVVSACDGAKRVADLFCGIGTFTLPLAENHQVLAVEGAASAVEGLTVARNMAQGLRQIVIKHRDLFRRPLSAKELAGFDAVVIDPPRAGAREQCVELAKSSVQRIVAVSCNPNTLARDARILADGGYSLKSLLPVDQFLWSPHLEVVAILEKEPTG